MANKFTPQSERALTTQLSFTFPNGNPVPSGATAFTIFRTRLKHDDDNRVRENVQDDRNHTFEALASGVGSKTVNVTGIGPITYAQIVEGVVKMVDAEKPA